MAGLYIHIPFCHKACVYCDFHFTTSLRYVDRMMNALLSEIRSRGKEFPQTVDTIYFGGGTPSVLTASQTKELLGTIYDSYTVNGDVQIETTIEANPEDITPEKVRDWMQAGINRVSLGIQSFNDEDLQWMNRGHSAEDAVNAVRVLTQSGIKNISADLIFGLPNQDKNSWMSNLRQLLTLPITHISLYSLTVEPRTELAFQVKKGITKVAGEDMATEQFELGQNSLKEAGFEQYEVSNYAKPGFESQHNSAYWRDIHYDGIGPSAHSFNGKQRRWNVANNQRYMKGIEDGSVYWEYEDLSIEDRYNEYLLTGLRSKWGCDMDYIRNEFGEDLSMNTYLLKQINLGTVILDKGVVRLSESGMLLADRIASELFKEA